MRGSGSITAGTDPLYVIDGFPMSSDAGSGAGQSVSPLSTINMNDIESIEVLKMRQQQQFMVREVLMVL